MRIKSEFLLKLRLDRGWTQEEVADKVGVDARTYRRYERTEIGVSHRAAQYEILRCIAAVFDLSGPDALVAEREHSEHIELVPKRAARRNMQPPAPSLIQPPDTPYHPHWYVHRDREEREAINKLRLAVAPIVLQGPRLYGKGTLLSYLVQQAATAVTGRVLRINVANLSPESTRSLDSLLWTLGRAMLSAVEMGDSDGVERRLAAFWERPGSAALKLTRLIQHEILEGGPFILAFEKVERLHGFTYQDDFFALLRGWAEKGPEAPWSRLRMMLTISTEPTLLDSIDHSSFFTLANPIHLSRLSPEQVEMMASLYGLQQGTAPSMEALLSGHPYLVRLALYQSVMEELSVEEILSRPHQTGPFRFHLKSLHRFIEENELIDVLRKVIANPEYALSFREYCRLYSQGLLYEEQPGVYRLRCGLYDHYFRPLCR